MKPNDDRLRREIAANRSREPFHARRYPIALRRAVIAHVYALRRVGHRPHRVARELGLTDQTLAIWMRSPSTPVLRPVTVVSPFSARPTRNAPPSVHGETGPVVVFEGGHRIDGLAFGQLVAVARADVIGAGRRVRVSAAARRAGRSSRRGRVRPRTAMRSPSSRAASSWCGTSAKGTAARATARW